MLGAGMAARGIALWDGECDEQGGRDGVETVCWKVV